SAKLRRNELSSYTAGTSKVRPVGDFANARQSAERATAVCTNFKEQKAIMNDDEVSRVNPDDCGGTVRSDPKPVVGGGRWEQPLTRRNAPCAMAPAGKASPRLRRRR